MFFKKKDTYDIDISEYKKFLFVHLQINDIPVSKINCSMSGDVIEILDIIPYTQKKYQNKGYGTKMMNELIKYARSHQYKYIIGSLSTVDLDHKERQWHFYQKFGFEITEKDNPAGNYYAEIKLML